VTRAIKLSADGSCGVLYGPSCPDCSLKLCLHYRAAMLKTV